MSDLEIYNLYERTNPGTIDTFQKEQHQKWICKQNMKNYRRYRMDRLNGNNNTIHR